MEREPAVIITTVSSVATAAIGLAITFGFDISDEQQKAILGFLGAFCTLLLILGPIIRTFVFSPNTTKDLVSTAEQAGATNSPAPVVQP